LISDLRVLGMVDLTEVSAVATVAGVLFGVIYKVLDIRRQTGLRQAGMSMRLYASAR
jgi:hypothetical protein